MQYASVLLFNAVVLTLDGNDAVASALALDGDRILAVGDRDGLAPLIGPDTECRDMGGAAVLPGFYDAHGHILMTAQGTRARKPQFAASWDLPDARRHPWPPSGPVRRKRPRANGCLPAASTIRCWRKSGSPAVGNWMRLLRTIPCSHSIFPAICAS